MNDNAHTKEIYRVVVAAVIYRNDGKYLLIRRGFEKKVHPGKWETVSGGLSADDFLLFKSDYKKDKSWYGVLERTLKREVFEETGLHVKNITFVSDSVFLGENGNPSLCLSYSAEYESGEVILEEGLIDFTWVTPQEACEYDLIEGVMHEIKIVEKSLKE